MRKYTIQDTEKFKRALELLKKKSGCEKVTGIHENTCNSAMKTFGGKAYKWITSGSLRGWVFQGTFYVDAEDFTA